MSKKRYVDDGFWTDPYVEQLDLMEKGLFLYLLTNPLCNVAGIYEISLKRLAYETGLERDLADKMLDRFVRDGKILRLDNWIVLVNFGKHQVLNPNMETGVRRIIGELPEKVKALKGFESLSYFTLLNLTILNVTEQPDLELQIEEIRKPITKEDSARRPQRARTTKPKNTSKRDYRTAQEILQILQDSTGSVFDAPFDIDIINKLLNAHGRERVREVLNHGLSIPKGEYSVSIKSPQDLARKWSQVTALMKQPEKESKYGIRY